MNDYISTATVRSASWACLGALLVLLLGTLPATAQDASCQGDVPACVIDGTDGDFRIQNGAVGALCGITVNTPSGVETLLEPRGFNADEVVEVMLPARADGGPGNPIAVRATCTNPDGEAVTLAGVTFPRQLAPPGFPTLRP